MRGQRVARIDVYDSRLRWPVPAGLASWPRIAKGGGTPASIGAALPASTLAT
jgi:hypothetical protein